MATFTNYHQPYERTWRHLLLERAKWDPSAPRTVVEIGSYEGSSAIWLMNNVLQSPESRLYCIDAWAGDEGQARYERFLSNIGELPSRGQIEVLRGRSQDGLRALHQRGVRADLLYVDGGHDAPTVLRDLVLGFDLVKPRGLVICDDYLWNDPRFGGNRTLGRPKIALDAFTNIYADKLAMVQGLSNIQVYFQKLAD